MVSPELLRRFPFFGGINEEQRERLAAISEQCELEAGGLFFQEGDAANALFILISGVVDLYFTVGIEKSPHKEYPVAEITAGDPFGISTLIEPYVFTSNARASVACQAIRINGPALRELCQQDKELRYTLTKQTARTYAERLRSTRNQWAASQE